MVEMRLYRVMQDGRQSVCIKDSDKGAVEEISLKAWGASICKYCFLQSFGFWNLSMQRKPDRRSE